MIGTAASQLLIDNMEHAKKPMKWAEIKEIAEATYSLRYFLWHVYSVYFTTFAVSVLLPALAFTMYIPAPYCAKGMLFTPAFRLNAATA